jgi:hypothetical protein
MKSWLNGKSQEHRKFATFSMDFSIHEWRLKMDLREWVKWEIQFLQNNLKVGGENESDRYEVRDNGKLGLMGRETESMKSGVLEWISRSRQSPSIVVETIDYSPQRWMSKIIANGKDSDIGAHLGNGSGIVSASHDRIEAIRFSAFVSADYLPRWCWNQCWDCCELRIRNSLELGWLRWLFRSHLKFWMRVKIVTNWQWGIQ